MSKKTRSQTYQAWRSMRACCGYIRGASPRQRSYYDGIDVCREWRDSYAAFERWAVDKGYCPGMAVVRVDKRGDFGPENCVVVTKAKANDMRSHVSRLVDGRSARDIVGPSASDLEQRRVRYRMFGSVWDEPSAVSVPPYGRRVCASLHRYKERIDAMKKTVAAALAAFLAVSALAGTNDVEYAEPEIDAYVTGRIHVYNGGRTATRIRAGAFAECRELEAFNAEWAESVGAGAFRGCVALETVYAGAVTNLTGWTAMFAGCPRLKDVHLPLVGVDAAKAAGLPFGTTSKVVTFHFADGDFDREGNARR